MNKIFYTDGSSKGNPGKGGFGIVEFDEKNNTILSSKSAYFDYTTNNRMELLAILCVLELANIESEDTFTIYSDSAYCVNIINDWMWNWARNNWYEGCDKEIKNLDLIKEIYNLCSKPFFNASVVKCDGHANILGNELADTLATNDDKKYNKLIEENNIQLLKI